MRKIVVVVVVVVGSILVPMLLAAQPKSDRQKLVDSFAKGLKSRNVAERVEAVEDLGRLESVEAIAPLVTALSDPDARVREVAAGALWDSSDVAAPAIPALRTALADPETAVVVRAAGALISMDVPAAELAEPLRLVLNKGDEIDRFLAARALIGIDPAGTLANPILDYLQRSTTGGAYPNRDNFESGGKALVRLTSTQDRTVVDPLMKRLRETTITQPVLAALGELEVPPDGWTKTLIESLSSPSAEARETAIELLEEQKEGDQIRAWVAPVGRLLTDPESDVRSQAVRTLAEARSLAIGQIDPLLALLKSEKEGGLRQSAATAVGAIADASQPADTAAKAAAAQKAMPVLLALIEKDPDMEVREIAVKSLDRLQLESSIVVQHLGQIAAKQTAKDVRHEALYALKRRGADAAPVEAMIAPLTKDPDEWTRMLAQEAIDGMRGETATKIVLTTSATTDAGARDRALETLRAAGVEFTEEAYLIALMQVKTDQVEAFLDAGMSPNHRFTNLMKQHALHVVAGSPFACTFGSRPTPEATKSLVKLLLARGSDPNLADEHGNTPLMAAAMSCDPALIKLLLDAKANINAKNSAGMTAFESSVFGLPDVPNALIDAGFRLSPDKVKIYTEAWAADPQKLALVKRATK